MPSFGRTCQTAPIFSTSNRCREFAGEIRFTTCADTSGQSSHLAKRARVVSPTICAPEFGHCNRAPERFLFSTSTTRCGVASSVKQARSGIVLGGSAEWGSIPGVSTISQGTRSRGVVLAVASKNNPDDAREPFHTNRDMLLELDDIAAFEASWEPKGTMLERIAETLNVGLDSIVFFDDNPAEREHIRQALPDVEVVEVPEDPAEYVRALESGHWFETTGLTAEDDARGRQYADERQRRERKASFGTIDDYLRSLEMIAELGRITDADLPRVVQLVSKTNQFNLTTKRHGHDDIVRMRELPGAIDLTLRLRDRFGEHGLVSVLIGTPENDTGRKTIRIETWLMSCRVISRGVEQSLYGHFLDLCQARGYERILGEYIPTRKNRLVAGLFDDLGFQRFSEGPDGTIRYELAVSKSIKPRSFVSLDGVLT